jgi:phosphonate transport system ATP-binding protein
VSATQAPAIRVDVRIDNLVVQAGARTLLQVPQLTIHSGERVALVGPNGAGKTTLLRTLTGFAVPAQGHVQVLGRGLGLGPAAAAAPLTRRGLRELRAQVGQVMQGLHLVPRLTARENVLIGALPRLPGWRSWARLYPRELVAQADAALAALGLAAHIHTRADRLSGGERQKVGIARLQMQQPRLILADEPTAALDPAAVAEACRALQQAAHGATLITVVHQPPLLPLLADRVLGLRGGRIVWDLPLRAVDAAALAGLYGPAAPPADAPSPQHAPAAAVRPACWLPAA